MPTTRESLITDFLNRHGMAQAVREKMGGDASFRRYERLHLNGKSTILMDAPPPQEDVRPFLQIARYLVSVGLCAPEILAEDSAAGLLLLEDFGDARYNLYLKDRKAEETTLYTKAIEALLVLHKAKVPEAPPYDEALLIEHVNRFTEWYVPHISKKPVDTEGFVAAWQQVLAQRDAGPRVLALFDFHADNLMWLPHKSGVQSVGLLDFQDAVIAPPTYDLVSLLQDCRRPISLELEAKLLDFYTAQSGLSATEIATSYAVMGAQRHTRILGTFARLAVRDKKPHYLDWVPKEWDYLKQNLAHPSLKPLQTWFESNGF